MKRHCWPGAVGLLAAATFARADWMFHDIRFAKPVIGPGESQTIEVWVEFAPWAGVGSSVPWQGNEVLAKYWMLLATGFTLHNVSGAETGHYSLMQTWNPELLSGIPGTIKPNGDVAHVTAFGDAPPGFKEFKANPGWLWSIEWTPIDYDPRVVTFGTASTSATALLANTVGFKIWGPTKNNWIPIHDVASFQVVPAPGATAALLALSALTAVRRRRA